MRRTAVLDPTPSVSTPSRLAGTVLVGVFLAGCFLAARPALAATLHVPVDHATIQPALDAAAAGDTILVAPGTYTGAGNRDLSFAGKDLVLLSTGGPEVTIIDVAASPDESHRGFLFAGGPMGELEGRAAVLDGFTIVNGFMGTPGGDPTLAAGGVGGRVAHDLSGAGIMVRLFASPTIRNCVIRNCHSEFTGGGIGVEFGSDPRLENLVIEACTAGIQGGGLSLETAAQATLVDCTITGCNSRVGGGAFLGETCQLTRCLVAGNSAARGGGINIAFPAPQLNIETSIIANNCAFDSAGGDDVFIDPAAGVVSFACCALDVARFSDSGSVASLNEIVTSDPLFCGPGDCGLAPSPDGDYRLQSASPCRVENSPCGRQIGPLGVGCQTPVTPLDWGRVKSIYRE